MHLKTIINSIMLISSAIAFTPTRNVHLNCVQFFEYIYTVECKLPSDTTREDIVQITSKNITSDMPLKLASDFMPEHIPQGIGVSFPNIEELRIWRADLKFIDRESFSDLNSLKILDLIGNAIELMPSDAFYELKNIEEIILSENSIKTLDENLLSENKKLKKFSAAKNQIEIIPSGFFKNNLDLNWIDFIKNNLKSVEVDFTELINLKTIGLSGNFNECNFNYGANSKFSGTNKEEFQENVKKFCRN